MTPLPTLSIVVVNRNAAPKLKTSLDLISRQDYPKELVEVLIVDAGSTDDSSNLAEKYGYNFFIGGYPDNQEARRCVGIRRAKNDIIVSIDADNYLPDVGWLRSMVLPFVEDADIFASQTLYYSHRKADSVLNRYFSLFGVNDPVAFYLNKADRMPHYCTDWALLGKGEDKGSYFKVTFKDELPTVGCNGFLVRRSVINEVLGDPEDFFHTDVIFDLVQKGHRSIAFVKNGMIHDTSDSLRHLIRKRVAYFTEHSVKLKGRRRYQVFDSRSWKDRLNLVKFVLYTVTGVKPLFDAMRGYLKEPDAAWFLHPVVCYCFLIAYGWSVILTGVRNRS